MPENESGVKIGPFRADHHSYIVPNVVDARVVADQAGRRWRISEQTTVVHHHRSIEPCDGNNHDLYPRSTS